MDLTPLYPFVKCVLAAASVRLETVAAVSKDGQTTTSSDFGGTGDFG
jgi:hypothetical protein